jgi:spore coat polysaccharide biosynthesis protein SpsF
MTPEHRAEQRCAAPLATSYENGLHRVSAGRSVPSPAQDSREGGHGTLPFVAAVRRERARVIAVVQARMTSARLPGKVLAEIDGQPALRLLVHRLRRAKGLDGIVVATSDHPSDDPVAALVEALEVPLVRGPLEDVLERYRIASEAIECDAVVRITADCPLMDPAVVDLVVDRWRSGTEAYVANIIEPRTFPVGLDVEVVSRSALEAAAAEANEPYDREHVTPFVRSRPDRFPQAAVTLDPPAGDVRVTLDTTRDLELLRRLVAEVGPDATMGEVLAALAGPVG